MTFKPQTNSEKLMYCTIRLEDSTGGSGTGFFFNFKINGKIVPTIITNKHVINYNTNESVKFFLHTTKEMGVPNKDSLEINFKTTWYFSKDKDLCFCFAGPIINSLKNSRNEEVFYCGLEKSIIWKNEDLEKLNMIEEVIMVGYPTGLWDKKNNLPLFRKGITSSHPAIDFNDKGIGVIDIACFPGSSGSPIFIQDIGGHFTKEGTLNLGKERLILLGILFEGPLLNSKGEIIVEKIPTKNNISSITPIMINLGYYIKSSEILEFEKIIKEKIKKI
jgi:hypothetical protein